MTQVVARPRDALQRRAIVAQNRLFSILSDVVRLVTVGGDICHAKLYRRAGKFWHDVASCCGALR